ncbi:uncharacterized protein LOC120922180 isoform X1 [Rana temporaria]|uniref:uncharacterized protein LOC120922180 isoform X1 n=1 Tax=Rana temporaria TaxID=8407 RepID=UPI001AADCD91|nr:uncharacterized protein LOC120922180 isoform X1 [Rana temporaria]
MASADVRRELVCSICLEIYKDPVMLSCGHNFCRVCIDRLLDTQEGSGGYSCPQCRKRSMGRPTPQRNITLCNIVETLRSTHPDQKTGIFCTYCYHSPVPAVKSCVLCEASLCDNHLRVHSKSPEHVLTDPTTSMENRKCSIHRELLKYYCTEDSSCICVSCRLDGDHQGHQVETLDEASENKKQKLRNVLQKLMTEREETEKRVQSLQEHKRNVLEKSAGLTKRVTALFIELRRHLEDLEKRVLRNISSQEERLSLSDLIHQLETKKEDLSRKMGDIEELCNMKDPLTVLQVPDTGDLYDTEDGDKEPDTGDRCDTEDGAKEPDTGDLCDTEDGDKEPDTGDLCDTEDGDKEPDTGDLCDTEDGDKEPDTGDLCDAEDGDKEPDTGDLCDAEDGDKEPDTGDLCDAEDGDEDRVGHDGGDLDVSGILQTLHTLSDMIKGGNVCFYAQESSDILLDVNTAHNNLQISDDMKTVSWSDIKQNRPETPERFQWWCQILSSQSFSSGRHYWEVDVGESEHYRVGMCYPSIERRVDQSGIGNNKKSWGLCRYSGGYSLIHNNKQVRISPNLSSNRVRIDLDYEAGQISFYDLCDPIRHLHTFATTFTEPLHAGLCVENGHIKIPGGSGDV